MLYEMIEVSKMDPNIHKTEWKRWSSKLTSEQIEAIEGFLNTFIEYFLQDGSQVLNTSNFLNRKSWENTPLQAIYDHACDQDWEASALCYGLFFWRVMCKREEAWSFGRYANLSLKGMTYFRIDVEGA